MVCHHCQAVAHKYGRNRQGLQRYHCLTCSHTFVEARARLLDRMRVSEPRALQCLHLLMEGMSVRSVERVTGVHHTTILSLLVLAGERCERLLKKRIHKLAVNLVGRLMRRDPLRERVHHNGAEVAGLAAAAVVAALPRRAARRPASAERKVQDV